MKKLLFLVLAFFSFSATFGQAYFLNGSATATGNDCYQLTPALPTQNGTVWYSDQIDLNEPFDLSFEMLLGYTDVNGADGMCFVMHTQGTSAIGASGGGMGYLNFGTSLAVEFDTYQNSADYSDPSYDHIAIHKNGNVNHNLAGNIAGPVQMAAFNANTEDGQNHQVRIVWDPINTILSVYFDCNLRLQTSIDIAATIFGGQSLVNWGFTAGTGGLSNVQTVCLTSDILNSGDELTICPGASAVLSVNGSNPAGTFEWSPSIALSGTTLANPIASPDSSITYHVVYTDLCGITSEQDFQVNVEPLEVNAAALSMINCENPIATINSVSNINGVSFMWITSDGNFTSGTSAFSASVNSPGFYSVLTDYQGICQAIDTVTIVADYSDFQIITGGSQLLNCNNPNGSLSAMVNGFPNAAFNWTTSGGTINGGSTTPSINVAASGSYTVNATLNENCFDTETIMVNADFNPPYINLSCLSGLNCLTPTTIINSATNAISATYSWSGPSIQSGQGTGDIVVNTAGTYSLTITDNENGCESSANTLIAENFTTPSISIGPQDTLSCLHPVIPIMNVAVNNSNDYSIIWSTTEGFLIDGINGLNPNVSVIGDYSILATDNGSGCTDTQTIYIPESSSSQFEFDLIQFPTIVTVTDGDLLNACWSPFLPGLGQSELFTLFDTFELDIYNRWGNLIFESSVPTSFCPDEVEFSQGTYFYTLVMSSLCGGVENYQVSGTFLVK